MPSTKPKPSLIYCPHTEFDLGVYLTCYPHKDAIRTYRGLTLLSPGRADIHMPTKNGLDPAVLAHEAVHAAHHLIAESKHDPALLLRWRAPVDDPAEWPEENIAWLTEQIVRSGLREYEYEQSLLVSTVGA